MQKLSAGKSGIDSCHPYWGMNLLPDGPIPVPE
jgi:hypothetical protein